MCVFDLLVQGFTIHLRRPWTSAFFRLSSGTVSFSPRLKNSGHVITFLRRCGLSIQSHYTLVCYTDASSTGCASYMLDFHNTISHKLWSVEEAPKSSSYRERKAVSLGLESFLPLLKGQTI